MNDIVARLYVVLGIAFAILGAGLLWQIATELGRIVARRRAQQGNGGSVLAPDHCGWLKNDGGEIDGGDQGGMPGPVEPRRTAARPMAPDIGSGLLAGPEFLLRINHVQDGIRLVPRHENSRVVP